MLEKSQFDFYDTFGMLNGRFEGCFKFCFEGSFKGCNRHLLYTFLPSYYHEQFGLQRKGSLFVLCGKKDCTNTLRNRTRLIYYYVTANQVDFGCLLESCQYFACILNGSCLLEVLLVNIAKKVTCKHILRNVFGSDILFLSMPSCSECNV